MVVPAKALQDGHYEASIKLNSTSTYYLFVGSRSSKLKYTDLPFFSLMGVQAQAGEQAPALQANNGRSK